MSSTTFQRSAPNLPISRFLLFFFLFVILGLNGSTYPPASYLLFFSPLIFLFILFFECHVRKVPFPTPDRMLLVLWFALLLFSAVSIPFSLSPAWTMLSLFRIVFYATFCLFVSLFRWSSRDVRRLSSVLLFAVAFLLAQSYLFLLPGMEKPSGSLSLVYAFFGHNHISDALLLVFPLVFLLSLRRGEKIFRWLFVLLVGTFFISFSRMGLVVAFLSLVLTVLLMKKYLTRRLVVLLAFFAIVVSLFLVVPTYLTSQESSFQAYPWFHRQLFKGFSAVRRLAYWEQAWQTFTTHPIGGTGLGTFRLVSGSLQTTVGDYSWFTHNWYLQTLAEQGVIGFSLWLLLLFVLFRSAFRAVLSRRKNPYVVGLFMGAAASAIHSFFDFDWEFPGVFLAFLVILSVFRTFSVQRRAKQLSGHFALSLCFFLSSLLFFVGIITVMADLSWSAGQKISLRGDTTKAQASFLQSVRLNPLDVSRLQRYVRLYGPCCFPEYDAFLFHPQVPSLYEAYANWYVRQGNFPEAASAFEKSLSLTLLDRPDLIFALGDVYKKMGEPEKQFSFYRDYIDSFARMPLSARSSALSSPSSALIDIFNVFISSALSRREYEKALNAFSILVSTRPYGPQAYLAGGIVDYAKLMESEGNSEDAYLLLSRYLDIVLSGDIPLQRLDTAHRSVGEAAFLLSRYSSDAAEEEQFLKQAIRLDPWIVEYYLTYGDLLQGHQRTNEARSLYIACLSYLPKDYHCSLRLQAFQ
ncbi:MAG: hypothetical protein A2900_01265 [Candidatus Chisholmbacteria bacterium RIFCSPLOWO2_01_FULL_50_28]|uniref:O-antigen ligase-related domain-containing protein n=1 Tax=Candidatus Chisholmbacteria bacterium RIFCSPHIGHO2_01_FULL_52_32 TaxID=1797591 RepID=A0A1G1VU22_9BACT|nr:MAG: hypothetical protein A2786_05475 [Candidatus Chisholmbacteria bacterium RIFCSPHIGHO2_01_FULL_52_32]OGY19718.1 MAG: hypothetical protein A2900_01265 [Candidatus Chisholmbacteria bacterium RIFCSPLOWO2_01_FULL_50_28]